MSALSIWVLLTCLFPSFDPILSPEMSAWLQYLVKTTVSSECFPLEILPGVTPKRGVPASVFPSDFSVFSFYLLFLVTSFSPVPKFVRAMPPVRACITILS